MAFKRRLVLVLALAGLALAAPASALTISGGKTTITWRLAVGQRLADHGVSAKTIAPAEYRSGRYVLPVLRSTLDRKVRGAVRHDGGVRLKRGRASFVFRRPVLVLTRRGVMLRAAIDPARCHTVRVRRGLIQETRRVCRAPVHDVAQVVATAGSFTTATALLRATRFSAGRLDRLARAKLFAAGDVLGTIPTEVKFAPAPRPRRGA